jgi:hypothetical protein
MYSVRPSTIEDVDKLAPKLRKADLLEIEALGQTPWSALSEAVYKGFITFTVVASNGDIVAMFGVAHHPLQDSFEAMVWMVGTDDLKTLRTALMRDTGGYLKMFHEHFPLLWNVVDQRNTVHISWLKRMGFTPLRTFLLGPHKLPFIQFVRIDPSCVPLPQPGSFLP